MREKRAVVSVDGFSTLGLARTWQGTVCEAGMADCVWTWACTDWGCLGGGGNCRAKGRDFSGVAASDAMPGRDYPPAALRDATRVRDPLLR